MDKVSDALSNKKQIDPRILEKLFNVISKSKINKLTIIQY